MKSKDARRQDALDRKIVTLFEKRMAIAEKTPVTRQELKRRMRRIGDEAAEKATRFACNMETISYTEELIKLMLCASCKYQKKRQRRCKDMCIDNKEKTGYNAFKK